MKRKMNIGFAPTRNYNKVSVEFLEEEIEFENEVEFTKKLRSLQAILRAECHAQFETWNKEIKGND